MQGICLEGLDLILENVRGRSRVYVMARHRARRYIPRHPGENSYSASRVAGRDFEFALAEDDDGDVIMREGTIAPSFCYIVLGLYGRSYRARITITVSGSGRYLDGWGHSAVKNVISGRWGGGTTLPAYGINLQPEFLDLS